MNPNLLFVYGTLRGSQSRSGVLKGCEYIGEHTLKGYGLYDLGSFPAIRKENSDNLVHGEVYRVIDPEVWATVDAIEGHPNFYKRTLVQLNDEYRTPCWAYVFYKQAGTHIKSGNWLER